MVTRRLPTRNARQQQVLRTSHRRNLAASSIQNSEKLSIFFNANYVTIRETSLSRRRKKRKSAD